MSLIQNIINYQEKIWDFVFYFSYFLYFLFVIGFANNAPEYLIPLNYYVQIYVSLFLIIRFNPLRNVEFTELDRKIAFSAGLFILTTTAIAQYFNKISKTTKQYISSQIKGVDSNL